VFRIAGFEYTSGVVNSIAYPGGRGFQQLYGYFEARIQPSSGEHNLGMCPAFWSEWLQSIVAFVVHEWTLSLRLDLLVTCLHSAKRSEQWRRWQLRDRCHGDSRQPTIWRRT